MSSEAGADVDELADRLATVRATIGERAAAVGRAAADVTLVAVGKSFPAGHVRALAARGQREFGESRAQELREKARQVVGDVRWHFVGRLQRNKVKHVVGTAALIHSVDRDDLARAVADRARRAGIVQPVLLQVNVGRDPAKTGVALEQVGGALDRMVHLEGIVCEGLMTIPPDGADPRPLFARLRRARDDVRERHPGVTQLSMGMSRDFGIAIEEGATIVRLGEAVFGRRPQPV